MLSIHWLLVCLAIEVATFAFSAGKHGGQLVNEFFIYSEDITRKY